MSFRSRLLAFCAIILSARCQEESEMSFLSNKDFFMAKQFVDSLTAYGPGLGVFAPYSYVDLSYDNLPFIGKIPVIGKEGTASRLGISPFYPPEGNPSNPFPDNMIYRARPLPMHVIEPVDIVAVPLDEEALHGEPLFPKELTVPGFMEMAGKAPPPGLDSGEETASSDRQEPPEPFGNGIENLVIDEITMPTALSSSLSHGSIAGNHLSEATPVVIEDSIKEKSAKGKDVMAMISSAGGGSHPETMGDGKGSTRRRTKRLEVLESHLVGLA